MEEPGAWGGAGYDRRQPSGAVFVFEDTLVERVEADGDFARDDHAVTGEACHGGGDVGEQRAWRHVRKLGGGINRNRRQGHGGEVQKMGVETHGSRQTLTGQDFENCSSVGGAGAGQPSRSGLSNPFRTRKDYPMENRQGPFNAGVDRVLARLLTLEALMVMQVGERYVDNAKADPTYDAIGSASRDVRMWFDRIADTADFASATLDQESQKMLNAIVRHVELRLAR